MKSATLITFIISLILTATFLLHFISIIFILQIGTLYVQLLLSEKLRMKLMIFINYQDTIKLEFSL